MAILSLRTSGHAHVVSRDSQSAPRAVFAREGYSRTSVEAWGKVRPRDECRTVFLPIEIFV